MSIEIEDAFISLDTETTGFEPSMGHKIIEIGAYEIKDGKPTGNDFHQYVDPQRDIPFEATQVHGMTRPDCIELGRGQVFKDIAEDLFNYLSGKVLVIHNAQFDMAFLDAEFKAAGMGEISPHCKVIDSLGYANNIAPNKKNNLDALAKRYGVTGIDRSLHSAIIDSEILAQVFLAMRNSQKHLNMQDVIKSVDSKIREFKLSDVIKPISPEVSKNLVTIDLDDSDEKQHKDYLSSIDDDLSW